MPARPGNTHGFQPGHEGGPGRPVAECTPEHIRMAKHACRLGATDQELAAMFGYDMSVIRRWMITNEDFSHACKVGGDMCDARVERGLFQRATGGVKKTVREAFNKEGEIEELITLEELPPDTAAATRWLEARKRKDWGIKSVVEHQGDLQVRDSRSALAILVARSISANAQQPIPLPPPSEEDEANEPG